MKQFTPALATLAILLIGQATFAHEFAGKVVAVVDGDTLHVLTTSGVTKVRLADIDCPEKAQPFGQRAKLFTSELVFGKRVTVQFRDRDRYGRIVGQVTLPNGRILNREIIKSGYGWQFTKYSKDETLAKLQRAAKAHGRGLWSVKNPIPPWEFRERLKRGL